MTEEFFEVSRQGGSQAGTVLQPASEQTPERQEMITQLRPERTAAPTAVSIPDAEEIIERLEAVLSSGVTMARASQGCGVPVNQLEMLLDNKTRKRIGFGIHGEPDRDAVLNLEQVDSWLVDLDNQRRADALADIPTPTRRMIEGIATRALREKVMITLVGSYGVGKSSSLKRFALTHPWTRQTPGALYVPFAKEDKGASAVYRTIADAMRLNTHRAIGRAVRDALRPGDLILCDKVEYLLESGMVNVLSDIHDETPVSIIAAANEVYTKLTKFANDDTDAFFNRAIPVRIPNSSEGDVDASLVAYGLSGEALRADAVKIATRPGREGGLRNLFKVIDHAKTRAASTGRTVDAKLFRQAARELSLL